MKCQKRLQVIAIVSILLVHASLALGQVRTVPFRKIRIQQYWQTMKAREEARSAYLDNYVKWVEVRVRVKQLNKRYRDSLRKKIQPEQVLQLVGNQAIQPARQLEVDGKIQWPELLASDAFKRERAIFDVAVRQSNDSGSMPATMRHRLSTAEQSMQRKLGALAARTNADEWFQVALFFEELLQNIRSSA